jgi:acetyltransferase
MSSVLQYKPDAEIEGVTLQPYFSNPDFEILMGAKRDKGFGPVILFGMGGIFTEVLKDRSLGLPPMNRLLASRLMQETKVYTLLKGYRNRPAADMEKLEEMIIRLSQLLIDFPQIAELDMNPVLIKDGSPVAVDAPLFKALFKTLTPTTIYYRFFGALKGLNPELLARFTQIDYDREIALVALDETAQTDDSMLGVARIIGEPDGKTGEFSVLVGDAWQGKGIGSRLLERCLAIAQKQGYETVHGIVLGENRNMLALGKKLGFDKDNMAGTETQETGVLLFPNQAAVCAPLFWMPGFKSMNITTASCTPKLL